jgi:hypothetical protein
MLILHIANNTVEVRLFSIYTILEFGKRTKLGTLWIRNSGSEAAIEFIFKTVADLFRHCKE